MVLKNSVAILTGSGRVNGVGASVARLLAAKGCNLLINALKNQTQASQIIDECKQYGVEVVVFMADLTKASECKKMADFINERWGRVDVLVNCLGFSKGAPYQELNKLTAEDFSKMFAVNATAPYLIVQALQSLLQTTDNSCVVNVSSAAGITGKGSSIAYATSKGALNTLTLALAQALSPKVRVNAVCPSFIDSSWWEEKFIDKEEQYQNLVNNMKNSNLLNRVLTPDDVAKMVVSIIENPVITGELIRLDAGAHVGKANKQ